MRGPIRWRGRAERGGKEWEYFGFWKKLEGERGAGGGGGGGVNLYTSVENQACACV